MFRGFLKWLVRFFALSGFLSFVSFLALLAFVGSRGPKEPKIPAAAILHLDFAAPLRAMPVNDPFTALFEPDSLDIFSLTEAIRRAASDPRIKGIVADVSFAAVDLASAQEIHEALETFKKSGKFTLGFADSFGEGGNSTGQYFLASGFKELWMQPSGSIGLIGLGADLPFFKKTLDWAGLKADFIKHEDYKTAMNMVTEEGLTPAHREQVQDLLSNLYKELETGLTANRTLSAPLLTLVNNGPYLAKDALGAKLIDRLGYYDEVKAEAEKRLGTVSNPDDAWVTMNVYNQILKKETLKALKGNDKGDKKKIALLYLNGAIMRESDTGPRQGPSEGGIVVAADMVEAINQAAKDKTIGAMLLRIDSPGGSYTASDTIYRALMKFKATQKPLVVSMAGTAASGGYYVALAGDKIFANPAAITGSIGVFGGKIVVADLAAKAKVNSESLQIGQNALMWSPMQPFTGTGRQAFQQSLDFVFEDFRAHVAKDRKLPRETVDSLAGGRVFTGRQAAANKLVDATGSLRQAMLFTKGKLGYTPDAFAPIVVYPHAKSPSDMLKGLLGGGIHGQAQALGVLMRELAPWRQSNGVQMRMDPLTLAY